MGDEQKKRAQDDGRKVHAPRRTRRRERRQRRSVVGGTQEGERLRVHARAPVAEGPARARPAARARARNQSPHAHHSSPNHSASAPNGSMVAVPRIRQGDLVRGETRQGDDARHGGQRLAGPERSLRLSGQLARAADAKRLRHAPPPILPQQPHVPPATCISAVLWLSFEADTSEKVPAAPPYSGKWSGPASNAGRTIHGERQCAVSSWPVFHWRTERAATGHDRRRKVASDGWSDHFIGCSART